jgi:hypothetical protein
MELVNGQKTLIILLPYVNEGRWKTPIRLRPVLRQEEKFLIQEKRIRR